MGCIAEAWAHWLLAWLSSAACPVLPGGPLLRVIDIAALDRQRVNTLSLSSSHNLLLLVLWCVHTNPFRAPDHNLW
ncbi:hypothetical protein B0H11DRAFT_2252629 [Mycena galericulata]|nr:hypothetical protein B0H11DRAFT_2252629 [Mycena galericulata]